MNISYIFVLIQYNIIILFCTCYILKAHEEEQQQMWEKSRMLLCNTLQCDLADNMCQHAQMCVCVVDKVL